jgi:signal transduction histidine kinase
MCDRERMTDVFSELARNAIIMKPGGVNIIVQIRQHSTNGVEILFQDDGPGVLAELKGRIFERFFSRRPGRREKGTGLGLSFVQKIIEAHGGQIKEIGTPGAGACFQILLPSEMFPKKGGE